MSVQLPFLAYANVQVVVGAPIALIVRAARVLANLAPEEPTGLTAERAVFYDGRLFVPNVTQAQLDQAFSDVSATDTTVVYRVASVLPVPFRWAARQVMFSPGVSALAALEAAVAAPGMEDQKEALEYMVRAFRTDLVAGGMSETIADQVLTLAATRPDSEPIREAVPHTP